MGYILYPSDWEKNYVLLDCDNAKGNRSQIFFIEMWFVTAMFWKGI